MLTAPAEVVLHEGCPVHCLQKDQTEVTPLDLQSFPLIHSLQTHSWGMEEMVKANLSDLCSTRRLLL